MVGHPPRMETRMTRLRPLLLGLGIVAMLLGVLFVAQGSGLFPYPRASFMIDQTPWIWRGAILFGLGALTVGASLRRRR